MTKNEDLKALTVHDELFTLVESQTGKVLLHSEMNDIINVVEKYSTRPTVTPTNVIPLSSEEEFRSVCSPILSGQSIDLLIKQFRHFYPNGIKLKGEKS